MGNVFKRSNSSYDYSPEKYMIIAGIALVWCLVAAILNCMALTIITAIAFSICTITSVIKWFKNKYLMSIL